MRVRLFRIAHVTVGRIKNWILSLDWIQFNVEKEFDVPAAPIEVAIRQREELVTSRCPRAGAVFQPPSRWFRQATASADVRSPRFLGRLGAEYENAVERLAKNWDSVLVYSVTPRARSR